jgi:predicted nucleotidyltransferase
MDYVEEAKRIVTRELSDFPARVFLFGSRASGCARTTSDIDVAIDATLPLPAGLMGRLREALEESPIPYRVDVVDLAEVEEPFLQKVRREGLPWNA